MFDRANKGESFDELWAEYQRLPHSHRAARRRVFFKMELAVHRGETECMRHRY